MAKSKVKKYIQKVNALAKQFAFDKATELETQKQQLVQIHTAFVEIYGSSQVSSSDCSGDDGFATVPGVIVGADGSVFVALLDICVMDSGEHYGTTIICEKGFVEQADETSKQIFKPLFPYTYYPAVEIIGDIHRKYQKPPIGRVRELLDSIAK